LLGEHFRRNADAKTKPLSLASDTLKILMKYIWPGNIRELQNTLETAVLFAEGRSITPASLEFKPALFGPKPELKTAGTKSVALPSKDLSPDLEKILKAIRDNGYHKGNAATALGISRRNLYVKLEKFEVPVELKELKVFIDERLG
jgi:DNA-binding NtrC family response regulator